MEKFDELKDIVLEWLEEHKQVKTLLREMENHPFDVNVAESGYRQTDLPAGVTTR